MCFSLGMTGRHAGSGQRDRPPAADQSGSGLGSVHRDFADSDPGPEVSRMCREPADCGEMHWLVGKGRKGAWDRAPRFMLGSPPWEVLDSKT